MTEEEKAAQEKVEQDKKNADELAAKKAADEAANKITVKDGKVELSEKQYNDLLGMKEDMGTYKEAKRKAEAELEKTRAAQEKAKEDKLIEDNKFKELFEKKEKENLDMKSKFNDQEITSALTVKLLEAGIKGEYVKLIDKSKVIKDGDTGEISGVDEVVKSFVENHPELVKTDTAPLPVDTTQGGENSGTMSDDDVRALGAKALVRIKKENPELYKRWSKLATEGKKSSM